MSFLRVFGAGPSLQCRLIRLISVALPVRVVLKSGPVRRSHRLSWRVMSVSISSHPLAVFVTLVAWRLGRYCLFEGLGGKLRRRVASSLGIP